MQPKSLVSFDHHGMFTLESPELLEAVSAAKLGDRALKINNACPSPHTLDEHCPGLTVNKACDGNGLCGMNIPC